MNTLLWVLAGVLAYTVGALALQSRGHLPDAVRVQGPLTTLHTTRGRAFLDWLSRPKRVWRAWSNIGVGITLVVMAGLFAQLASAAALTLVRRPEPTSANRPENYLIIPGVNDFLPLSVAPEIVFGLLVALVVHEGGHGLLCRVEGIDIDSLGLVFLTIVPVGAFVEPDEESQRAVGRGGRTRMFAAGVTNNFAITILAFGLLFGPVIGAVGLAPGLAVDGTYEGSPAAAAGIGSGDRITELGGQPVNNESELENALATTDAQKIDVEVDGERTVTVDRSVVIVGTVQGNPANLSVSPGGEPIDVMAVNGTSVSTTAEFREAVGNGTFARLETSEGTVTAPIGTYAVVSPDGPLAEANAPANTTVVITHVDGQRIVTAADLRRVLDETEPGQTVTVRVYQPDSAGSGTHETYVVELGENPQDGRGLVGVNPFEGTGGLVVTDFGVREYPAGTYLGILGGDGGPDSLAPVLFDRLPVPNQLLGQVYFALILPLASVTLGLPNFPGFTGAVRNFYVIEGPLAPLGDGVFLLANLLFWIAWINLQLGIFNCIPGYPLDGGRILRTSAEAVVSRLPVGNRHRVVRTITTSVGVTMLVALLTVLFGPQLLG